MTKLDEYFDRARRETPPLQKDEVSSILLQKQQERRDRETAHTRGNGVWSRSIGRIFLTFPLKGWIMISALLTSTILATALFWQATPQSAYNGASASQTLPAAPQAAAPTSVSQKKLALKPQTEPKYAVKTQVSKPEALTTINTQTLKDSLPAPYDFVPIDEEPFIDVQALMQKVIYPEVAKKLGLEGKVNVRILVLPDGSVSRRSFIEYSDVHLFDSSALNSVYATRWEPAKRAGKAVPCWVSVPIHYRLNERIGKNAVTKAQMLTLTAEELKKIGVEQQEEDILQIVGWKKSHEDMLQMCVSINSQITPKLMGDSVFTEYVHNLRKQGKYALAADWERTRYEQGKRSLRELLNDSVRNFYKSGLTTIVSTKKRQLNFSELRDKARQLSLPRLVTDGHNYRYFVDISDLPRLQRWRAARRRADEFIRNAKLVNMDSIQIMDTVRKMLIDVQDQEGVMHKARQEAKTDYEQIQDSINKIFAYVKDTTAIKISTSKDSKELTRLIKRLSETKRQEETQFEQEKSDISKLIGIRIPSKQARAEGDEYLLWYDPTPEFIVLLPERYRTGLEREVAAAKKYATKCEIPTEEERKAIPGYFDSWRSCDGVLKIASIFPNPADVKATVRFTLAEARSVTITVHNLNGDRLAILEPTPMLTSGEHELPLDFTGRNVGVYLLALSTDKNETAIKRVIISR